MQIFARVRNGMGEVTIGSMQMLVYMAVSTYVGVQILRTIRSPRMSQGWELVRGLRGRHFVKNIPAQTLVVVAASILTLLPGLSWGWWGQLGGEGSIVMAQNSQVSGFVSALMSTLIVLGLCLVIPALALSEELVFRKGSERRGSASKMRWAFGFGMVHLLMGIPIGVGVALGVAGVWFTKCYMDTYNHKIQAGQSSSEAQKNAINEAVRYHMAWNWSLIVLSGLLVMS